MKQLAVVLAAVLSLTLVAPALAQPFADVPTEHWAYDAIAELAAKGLIEGYPDGSFKGDRAMTRYEMAMVVARLLARIEAIKIPPLPTDLVRTPALTAATAAQTAALRAVDTRLTAKLATIQRLVAEFRAELAALGVRVTAVEEELAAIRARLDNTKITGDMRFRYNVYPTDSPSGSGTFRHPDPRIRFRMTFTGTAGPNVQAVVRLFFANNLDANAYDVRFGENQYHVVTWDYGYIDIKNVLYGNWRGGRMPFSLGYTFIDGALLYDPTDTVAAMTPFTGAYRAGLSEGITGSWALGPFNATLAIFRENTASTAFGSGGGTKIKDFRMARVSTGALLPGWVLGGHWFQEYVPGEAPVATPGGTGWGVDFSGTLIPGLRLFVDYATWQSTPCLGCASIDNIPAWRVGGNADLGRLFGITMWSPNVDFQYKNYGSIYNNVACVGVPVGTPGCAVPPEYTYGTTYLGQYHTWNMKGFQVRLNLTFSPTTTGFVSYEGGDLIVGGQSYSEWWLRLVHTFAPRTSLALNYYRTACSTAGGVPCPGFSAAGVLDNWYRAELLYSW